MVCDITTGLVAYWSFTGDATDSVGSLDGTVTGATLSTDKNSVSNQAYSYDGVNDNINLGNTSSLSVKSISLWGYIDSTGTFNGNTPFISAIADGSNFFIISINSAQGIAIQLRIGGSVKALSAFAIPYTANIWQHWVFTIDGTNIRLYKNGVLSDTNSAVATDFMQITANTYFAWQSFNNVYSKVKIDEVRFYSTTLDQDSIDALYSGYDVASCGGGSNGSYLGGGLI